MNDPHIEALYYRFISDNPNDQFKEAPPFVATLQDFDIELNNALLTVKPKAHFSDVEEVKAVLDPFLRSWESAAFLSRNRYRIRFQFRNAKVVDRRPPPGVVIIPDPAELVATAEVVTVIRVNTEYPQPSSTFRTSPFTDDLIDLLKRYQDGRIPLTAMTNWFETKLRKEYKNRDQLSKKLNVQRKVLDTIGRLSESSDPVHGRKEGGHGPTKLSPEEISWLEAVVVLLVERIGEINAGYQNLPVIVMNDLPKL